MSRFRSWARFWLWSIWPLFAGSIQADSLPHDAYVWQRAWSEPVRSAVSGTGTHFNRLVVLAAEVTWKNQQPQTTLVAMDATALRANRHPIGLALRIGPSAGPFRSNDAVVVTLSTLAHSLLATASSKGLTVAELQLDFDCAESKLSGYQIWVQAIRRQIAPTPLIITALPSWLRQPAFAPLAAACDGFVLQVHSLARPQNFHAPFTLCDPVAAIRAVELAGKIGRPFRVALPTYGYYVAFDAQDRFIGLAADGPSIQWPAGTKIREVRSDPAVLGRLVMEWDTNHPATLRGFIWYRLPIENEILNWRFSTLSVVMSRRVPQADLKVESRSPEPELVEVFLRNEGSADFQNDIAIRVRARARVVASDAVGGFDLEKLAGDFSRLHASQFLLRAGEARKIGWLRLNRKAEVELEISK